MTEIPNLSLHLLLLSHHSLKGHVVISVPWAHVSLHNISLLHLLSLLLFLLLNLLLLDLLLLLHLLLLLILLLRCWLLLLLTWIFCCLQFSG